MANTLYPVARSAFLTADLDWVADAMTVALLSSAYTYNSAHTTSGSLTGVLDTETLAGKAVLADGVADADDVTTMAPGSGTTVRAVVIYRTSDGMLVYFADTQDDGTAINRPGTGGAMSLLWSASANRVFRL